MNLKSVDDFARSSPFTVAQLRWHIFNAKNNGMDAAGAVIRIGRRVYIDLDGFDRWIAAQNPKSGGENV